MPIYARWRVRIYDRGREARARLTKTLSHGAGFFLLSSRHPVRCPDNRAPL